MSLGLAIDLGSSGRQFPGILSLDREAIPGAQVCDIRLGLPFGQTTVDIVVSSHCLEHLHPFHELPRVLEEIQRVLKPGGLLRVAIPDLTKLVSAYTAPDSALAVDLAKTQQELGDYVGMPYEKMPLALKFSAICFGDNSGSAAYDGHRWCGDFETLKWFLEQTGFADVQACKYGESRHPTLMQTYQDTGAAEEIIVEAVKP